MGGVSLFGSNNNPKVLPSNSTMRKYFLDLVEKGRRVCYLSVSAPIFYSFKPKQVL